MGILSDIDALTGKGAAPVLPQPEDSSFSKGLRSGATAAGGSLRALGANIAEVAGADDFAREQYAESRAAQDLAAQQAPDITSYKQVDGLRSAGSYVAGLAGQSVPYLGAAVGAGLLTRGKGLRPLAAATAATAPLETGNIIQSQQEDPEIARRSAGERLATAGAAGVGSAALQNIVPLAVTGQLESKIAAGASRATKTGIVAKNAALGVGGEGAAEAGGQLVQQQSLNLLNPNRDTSGDVDQLKEAFVGGAAVGAPLAGIGAARELATRSSAPAAVTVTDTAKPDLVQRARGLFAGDKNKEPLDLAEARRVAADEELVDPAMFPDDISTADASKIFEEADVSRTQKTTDWAKNLFEDPFVTPEQRATLQTAAADLTDRANQATVAGVKVARDTGKRLMDQVDELYKSVIKKPAADRSEVPSALGTQVNDVVASSIADTHPELVANTQAMSRLNETLTDIVEQAKATGRISTVAVGKLQNILGDRTRPVLQQLHDSVLGDSDETSTDNFYKAMLKLSDDEVADRSIKDVVRGALKPELAKSVSPGELNEAIAHIRDFVAERYTSNMSAAQAAVHKRDIHNELRNHFGDKTDDVINAVAADVKRGSQKMVQDRGAITDEEAEAGAETQSLSEVDAEDQYEAPKFYGRKPYQKLENDSTSQYAREYAKAQADNPDRNISFVEARHLPEDHPNFDPESRDGFVVAEGMKQEGRLTAEELNNMKLDTTKTSHLKNSSRIDTGVTGVTLDAKRIASVMQKKLPYNESDDKSSQHRLARTFMEGIAAAQDSVGKAFEVADNTVVASRGGKDITFGDLRKLSMRPEDPAWMKDKSTDEINERLRSEEALKESTDNELKKYQKTLQGIADKRQTSFDEHVKELRDNKISLKGDDYKFALKEFGLDAANKHIQALNRVNSEIESRAVEGTAKERVTADGKRHGSDVSPDSNVHDTVAALGEKGAARKVDFAGDALQYEGKGGGLIKADGSLTENGLRALDTRLNSLEAGKSAVQRNLAAKGRALEAQVSDMTARDQTQLARIIKTQDTSTVGEIINELSAKYKAEPRDVMFNAQTVKDPEKFDEYIKGEKFSSITDPSVMVRFLKAARDRFDALTAKEKEADAAWERGDEEVELTKTEKAVMQWVSDSVLSPSADTDVFLTELDAFQALPKDEQKKLLAEVGDLKEPKKPSAGQASEQKTGTETISDADRKAVEEHVAKTLGPKVLTEFKKMLHAGEFERFDGNDIIRVSTHALDPMSVAYHESLHAFFAKLRDSGDFDAIKTIFKSADSVMVKNQLRKLLDGEPAALKQVAESSEERAAYMYQFWVAGKLQLGDKSNGVMQKLADFFRKVLGIWSNDKRAEHILDYFNSGEYAKNLGDRSAVASALDQGNSKPLKQAKKMAEPLLRLADSLVSSGDGRLRATQNPSLIKVADLLLRQTTGEGQDAGFIPAAREKRTKVLNDLAAELRNINAEDLQDALESLQNKKVAGTVGAQRAAKVIRSTLDDMYTYMKDAGVAVKDLGFQRDYFPRVWDDAYISSHQKEFREMMQKYVDNKQFKGSVEQLMGRLTRQDGSEIGIETNNPGMQHIKERSLSFIDAEDAAPFLRKDLFHTLNSYVTQATRRAEWARRFEDSGDGLRKLLLDAKKKHGATDEDIQTAEQYVRGVDGTLGDDINPSLRRVFGNLTVYQNIRLLPLAIFSSVVDPMGVMVRGGTMKESFDTFKRGVKEIATNFKKDTGVRDSATKLAEDLGVIDNAMLLNTLGTSYSQGMVGDTARKINDTFFKYNLMAQFNNSVRVGATEAAVGFLGRHAQGDASLHSKRWLAELGFAPGEIKMKDGRPLLRQEDFEAAGQKPEQAAESAAKMAVAINRWVDGAVLRPNAAQKPIWMNDPHWALVSHLKQFVYSFQQTIIKRVMHEYQHGNFSPALALASYVPVMIAADLIKGMIQGGGDQPEWKEGWGVDDYVWSGMQRAGLFGVGQFGIDVATDIHRGGVGIGALSGPTVEQLGDAVRVVGGPGEAEPFVLKSLPANALYSDSVRRP